MQTVIAALARTVAADALLLAGAERLSRGHTSGGGRGSLGYPWTRLGYTYNWHPGSPRYGASEYLVRRGARIRGDSTQPISAYCRRA